MGGGGLLVVTLKSGRGYFHPFGFVKAAERFDQGCLQSFPRADQTSDPVCW